MSENKRYYWLKLEENFFEDDTMAWLEEQENGKDYVIFYLKLCLKALKDDGYLIRYVGEKLIPYDVSALSKLTNTSVDTVAIAMKTFIEIGLLSRLDSGEIYFNQINEMIGSETRQAEIMRKKRAKEKLLETHKVLGVSNNVTQSYTDVKKSYTEKERDTELELKTELERKENETSPPPIDYEGIKQSFNEKCISLPQVAKMTDKRKQSILARVRENGIESIDTVIDNASKSKFMAGDNDRNWTATFDWIIKPNNYIKVLEGNYVDKGGSKNGADTKDDQYDLEKHGIGFSM